MKGKQDFGFTLIEAMVAIVMMTMMMLLTFGTISHTTDSYERAIVISERAHEVRLALERMSRELSMAFLSYHHDCSEPRTATIFQSQRTSFGMRLDFTSFSHVQARKDAKESDQNELSYFIELDRKQRDQKNLVRREQHRIDEKPDSGGSVAVMCKNVTQLNFQFYNSRTDKWEEEWQSSARDTWYRLPKYVKIALNIPGNGQEKTFVVSSRLMLRDGIIIPGNGFNKCLD